MVNSRRNQPSRAWFQVLDNDQIVFQDRLIDSVVRSAEIPHSEMTLSGRTNDFSSKLLRLIVLNVSSNGSCNAMILADANI